MPKSGQPNYPDILGYITNGRRKQIDVVDAAMTIRPRIARAGQTFEIILLLQNTTDVRVEVVAEPKVPARDRDGKTDQFILKTARMTAVLSPAEVGCVSLPMQTLPTATSENDYHVFINLSVKTLAKPRVVRQTDSFVNLSYYFYLDYPTIMEIAELKALDFSVSKTGLIGTSIEASFDLAPPGKAPVEVPEIKPAWKRLWSMSGHTDARPQLEQYGKLLEHRVLPLLTRENLYEPLYKSTIRRFGSRNYRLNPNEAHYITKLLVDILQMGREMPDSLYYPEQALYGVGELLDHGWTSDGRPVHLPAWCRSFLTRIASDNRVMDQPVKSLATILYDDLLQDGIIHGFSLVHMVIGRELGNKIDTERYASQFVEELNDTDTPLEFDDIYLPLILGGIIVDTDVPLPYENPLNRVHEIYDSIRQQRPRDAANVEKMVVYSVACKVCDWALRKHGYRL
ncbi:MAG: hypothetical protein CL610_01655 [Anaerolineaceae bacterium]|nr:hypothetical protein [Anaerolineaceae bacterium]